MSLIGYSSFPKISKNLHFLKEVFFPTIYSSLIKLQCYKQNKNFPSKNHLSGFPISTILL